jgi:hypothetical protein
MKFAIQGAVTHETEMLHDAVVPFQSPEVDKLKQLLESWGFTVNLRGGGAFAIHRNEGIKVAISPKGEWEINVRGQSAHGTGAAALANTVNIAKPGKPAKGKVVPFKRDDVGSRDGILSLASTVAHLALLYRLYEMAEPKPETASEWMKRKGIPEFGR